VTTKAHRIFRFVLNKIETDWGEAVSAEPRSVFFIGFFPVLSSHPAMTNKIVRLVQYEGQKFGQCLTPDNPRRAS
jgi:hypothetical protein